MKGKTTAKVPGTKPGMLDESRHILYELREILSGRSRPGSLDQKKMLDHLTKCTYCQSSVEVIVAATLDNTSESSSKSPIRKLLLRLKDALHKIQEREERIAAYAEALEASGVKEANKRFPPLAEHLKHCEVCRSEVEETRDVLRQAEQAGLIGPLREDAKARM